MEFDVAKFTTPWGVEISALYRPATQDWNTLYSCIVEDEYMIEKMGSNRGKVAVDIGAHIGGCTLALLSRGYSVIAVEALPENAEILQKNVEHNGWSDRLTLYNNAISGLDNVDIKIAYGKDDTEFSRAHKFIGNTLLESQEEDPEVDYANVKSISINKILKDVPIVDFLKIDCEGAEWAAFSGASAASIKKIKSIAAELHPVKQVTGNLWDAFNEMIGSDFSNVTESLYGDAFDGSQISLAFFKKQ